MGKTFYISGVNRICEAIGESHIVTGHHPQVGTRAPVPILACGDDAEKLKLNFTLHIDAPTQQVCERCLSAQIKSVSLQVSEVVENWPASGEDLEKKMQAIGYGMSQGGEPQQ